MDSNMNPSMDPSSRTDDSAGDQAQQPPAQLSNAIQQLWGADHTNPVKVAPHQVQMFARCDDHGRRYMVLENLPLDQNYVASRVNSGAEFAIGGTPAFIIDAIAEELTSRLVQDVRKQGIQGIQSLWHVVVLPDSNISNAPMFNSYRVSNSVTRGYPVATALRPTQQNPANIQPAMFPQQSHQTNQQAISSHQIPYINHQPMLTQQKSIGGYGQGGSSVAPSQQSQFTTPMPGTFRSGDGSTVAFPQAQSYSHLQQLGSFQGFDPSNGPAQGSYQGQGNNMMFNQSSGLPMGSLPQIHRPIFDKHGYIVGEEGNMNSSNMYGANMHQGNMYSNNMYDGTLYSSNMYGNNMGGLTQSMSFQGPHQPFIPAKQAQNTETNNPQAAATAQSFYSFVENKMDQNKTHQDERGQDEGEPEESNQGQLDQDERDQDEGIALGHTSSNDTTNIDSQQAASSQRASAHQVEPVSLPAKLLKASEEEPHRFADNTGTGLCDYCGRDGHEADVCLKWDPTHFDKPICTACNNDQHSLDECPKFRAMTTSERTALLLGKGALRPGVRSEYHAWTRYAQHGNYDGNDRTGLPLARVVLEVLSRNREIGSMIQNVWKVWDYGRDGVPDLFRQAGRLAGGLGAKALAESDENFKGGQHNLDRVMPVQRSVSRVPTEPRLASAAAEAGP